MIKCINLSLVGLMMCLFAQDSFIKNTRPMDIVLDRVIPASAVLEKEIKNAGIDYWFGETKSVACTNDSSLIAMARTDKPGGKVIGIWLVDVRTKKERQIIRGITEDLKWSSDGKYLTFSKMVPAKELFHGRQMYEDAGTWLYNVESGETRQLPPFGSSAVWSPGENYLAGKYIDSDGAGKNKWVLAIYDVNDHTTRILDSVLYQDWWNFAWSPNGEMIVYTSATEASGYVDVAPLASEVFIINKDGTGKKQITYTSQPEVFVRWLPDGDEIVVARYKDIPDTITGTGDAEIVVLKLREREGK